MLDASKERLSHNASTEAGAKARPSTRIRTRAPPCRGAIRIKRIVADRPTLHWSPQLITWTSSPCTNHAYPVKHLYKDYELLKRLLR